jgi:hypothetical protein
MQPTGPRLGDLLQTLYEGYRNGWSSARLARLEAALASGARGVTEPMVTDLLAAAEHLLGDDLIRIFLDAVGRSGRSTEGLTLLTGSNFRNVHRGACPHVPDIVVCEEPLLTPVVVIECKLHAAVNGGLGYCPQRPDLYINQVMAYPDGCWTSASLDWVSFLWIGSAAICDDTHGPWGPRAVRERDHELPNVDDQAWARQQATRTRWRALSWEHLVSRLGSDPASAALVRIIKTWADL